MVIDLKRCVGCYGCVIACKAEHVTRPGVMWARVLKAESGTYPAVRRLSLPLLCMQCRDPACLPVCPTGATVQREDGVVVIDRELCIGCRYCMQACPYGARYFNDGADTYFPGLPTPYEQSGDDRHPSGVVEKCDFCLARVERGLEPACVANCMTKARVFGDLDDPESDISRLIRRKAGFQLNPEFGTDPCVYYLPP
ncbi:MAG: 4Fe-4S dicluster domain-containing protein [Candidatus Rokubacteria bacterium]|nr:4Fe-4S dicluster domain-containing protein [Candidatus Rokubacteria bacterium]